MPIVIQVKRLANPVQVVGQPPPAPKVLVKLAGPPGPPGPPGPKGDPGAVQKVSGVAPDGSGNVDLSGVYEPLGADVPGINVGDVLTWDGATWQSAAPAVYDFQPADHGLLAWTFDPVLCSNVSTPFSLPGTLYAVMVKVPRDVSVRNIVAVLVTPGSGLTTGQCFAALYQDDALLGATANQSTAWASGTGPKTMPIAGGPVSLQAGTARIVFWFNGTTGPAFYRAWASVAPAGVGLGNANARFGTANAGVTTAAPATLTMASRDIPYWAGLS